MSVFKINESLEPVQKKIQDNLKQMDKLLDEACALADEHGVPFDISLFNFRNTYIPKKAFDALNDARKADPDIDRHEIELPDGDSVWIEDYGYAGWQTSGC